MAQLLLCLWQKNPGHFLMVSGEEPFPLWVAPSLPLFVTPDVTVLERLVDTLKMQMFTFPANYILLGLGSVKHALLAYHAYQNIYRKMGARKFRSWIPSAIHITKHEYIFKSVRYWVPLRSLIVRCLNRVWRGFRNGIHPLSERWGIRRWSAITMMLLVRIKMSRARI